LLTWVPAAAPGDPEVTDVTLGWTTSVEGYPLVQVTWQETGPLRNRVDVVEADGTMSLTGATVEADQPDRSTLPPRLISGTATYRVAVRTLDDDGVPVGVPALSPVFDTTWPLAVRLDGVNPRADGTVELRWTPRRPAPDTTPGDPLDEPVENPPLATPIVSNRSAYAHDELSDPVAGPSFVVPAGHRPPLLYGLKTVNKWGEAVATVEVAGTTLTATVPARAADGAPVRVTGTVRESLRACDLKVCWPVAGPEEGRTLQLQVRTGPGGGWRVAATARSSAEGTYRFTVISPGTRQYRVVAPPVTSGDKGGARGFAASAPVMTTSEPATGGAGAADGGDSLPITGASGGTGVLLVVLGVLLRAAGRRRSPA
jgi:hypothetical protein